MFLQFTHTIRLTFLAIFITASAQLKGQSADYQNNREIVCVHLDKLVYVSGEFIRYKAYLVDPSNPDRKVCSKILYFTLTGIKDKSVVSWRINLGDKAESNYFRIPADIKSGMYVLHAYTNWMMNGPADSYYSQNLLIMNLSEPTPDTLMLLSFGDTGKVYSSDLLPKSPSLSLKTSKSSYAIKEKVRLEINLNNARDKILSTDLSISVYAASPFDELLKEKDISATLEAYSESGNKNSIPVKPNSSVGIIKHAYDSIPSFHLREDKAFIMSGHIKSRKDNSPFKTGHVLLSIIDSISPHILYSHLDSSGGFLFYLGKMYDNKDLFLRLAGQLKNADYYWILDNKTSSDNHQSYLPYILKDDEKAFLNNAKNIGLVHAVYSKQQVKNLPDTALTGSNFFSPPNMLIYPGDYSDLVNFKEIADNILPIVKFTMRNDDYSLQILDPRSRVWKECNTILLNGVPFTELAYIATLGTKDIKRIEIISTNFMVGELTFPGLVSIYTNDNKIPEIYLKNNIIKYKNTVIKGGTTMELQSENTAPVSGDHNPDFRNNLYWKPNISISNKENLILEFPASMLTGKFIIKAQGYSSDGHPVSGTATFEVKEQ